MYTSDAEILDILERIFHEGDVNQNLTLNRDKDYNLVEFWASWGEKAFLHSVILETGSASHLTNIVRKRISSLQKIEN